MNEKFNFVRKYNDTQTARPRERGTYSFVHNNPIRNVDYNGLFVIAANDPNVSLLRSYVAAAKDLLADPYVYEIFKRHSGLTDAQIIDVFTEGKGPQLSFTDALSENMDAEYLPFYEQGVPVTFKGFDYLGMNPQDVIGKDKIQLDAKYFLKFKQLSSLNRKSPHNFYIAATILHELVHFGDLRVDGTAHNNIDFGKEFPNPSDIEALKNITKSSKYEPKDITRFQQGIENGKAFEYKLTGGFDISKLNIKEAFKSFKKNSKSKQPKSEHPYYSPRYL